jgi:hypothetical protein
MYPDSRWHANKRICTLLTGDATSKGSKEKGKQVHCVL